MCGTGLGKLPELNTLVLTRNRLAGLKAASLAGCSALAKLSLSHNALADLEGEPAPHPCCGVLQAAHAYSGLFTSSGRHSPCTFVPHGCAWARWARGNWKMPASNSSHLVYSFNKGSLPAENKWILNPPEIWPEWGAGCLDGLQVLNRLRLKCSNKSHDKAVAWGLQAARRPGSR